MFASSAVSPNGAQRVYRAERISGFCGFAPVRVTRTFDGRRNGILAAIGGVFATLNQIVRALAKFASFSLREIPAFIRSLAQVLASFFSGLGSEQNSDECADAETDEEEGNFGADIVCHEILQRSAGAANLKST
jgi:hypothetical protein